MTVVLAIEKECRHIVDLTPSSLAWKIKSDWKIHSHGKNILRTNEPNSISF